MTRYTVFGKSTKCPNCHAYLTGTGEQILCDYCGVMVTVEAAPPRAPSAPGIPAPPPMAVRAPDPTVLVRPPKTRTWPYFLVAPIMTGGILYYTYVMQKQAMDRAQAVTSQVQVEQAVAVENEVQTQARAAVVEDKPPITAETTCEPTPEQTRVVAACFDDAPRRVKKVEADVKLVVDRSGKVSDADLSWDGWKPDAKMRRCANRKIRAWKLAKPAAAPARCETRLSVSTR